MKTSVFGFFKSLDDFVIDRLCQPVVNAAFLLLGRSKFWVARCGAAAGGLLELDWLREFGNFPSTDFYWHLFCVGAIFLSCWQVVAREERFGTRLGAALPVTRIQGLVVRLGWLVLLAIELVSLAFARDRAGTLDFFWTLLLISPNWVVCCGAPPARRVAERVGRAAQAGA